MTSSAQLADGATEQAIASLKQALELTPRHQPSLEAISQALLKLGRATEALPWIDKWIALPLAKPRDTARAWCCKGVTTRPHRIGGADPQRFQQLVTAAVHCNKQQRHADALELLAQAERIDPDFADLHLARGMNLRGLARWAESIAALRRALELDSRLHHGWFFLADSLEHVGQLEQALVCFDRLLELAPDDTEAKDRRRALSQRVGRSP
jgi:tetratricopeptide (TPR) repeat protein